MEARYQLVQTINEGAFGRVYLAKDGTSGRQVAVKELKRLDDASRVRFAREIRLLGDQVDNKYVVELLDYNLDTNPPFIVMEYCDRGSLRAWVTDRQPWGSVAGALGCVAQGLASIHKAGGFHRDIKPDNLLVASIDDQNVIVKVADFGLARVPQGTTQTMTYSGAGTPGYIAPEILMGAEFHAGADIFSLGVVGLELLAGSPNLSGLGSVNAPDGLKELIRQMLSPAAIKRPNIQRVAQVLNEVLNPSPPPVASMSKWPSGTGSGVAAAVGIGAALLAIGGLAYLAANAPEWDQDVQRYRGRDGRFRPR